MTASKSVYHLEETSYSKADVEALLKGASSSSVHASNAEVIWSDGYQFAKVVLKVLHGFGKPEAESTQEILANNVNWVLGSLDQQAMNKESRDTRIPFQASVIIRALLAENEKLKLDIAAQTV